MLASQRVFGPDSAPGSFAPRNGQPEFRSGDGSRMTLWAPTFTCVTRPFSSQFPERFYQLISRISQSSALDELRSARYPCSHCFLRSVSMDRTAPPSFTPLGAAPRCEDNLSAPSPALSLRLVFSSGILLNLLSRTFSSQFLFGPPAHLFSLS